MFILLPTLIVAIGLVVALPNGAKNAINPVQAAEPSSNSSTSDAPTSGLVNCAIGNIAVFSNRIHVYCPNVAAPDFHYYAAWGDSAHALTTNRFLTVLNTAYALGKHVYLYYYDDPSMNPPGCNAGDCRALNWIFIVP